MHDFSVYLYFNFPASVFFFFFFFNDTATTEIYTLSLHDALPISSTNARIRCMWSRMMYPRSSRRRDTARPRFGGPDGGSVLLYALIAPQSATRPKSCIANNAAVRWSPPTLSKYTSMPSGAAAA